MNKAIVFSVSLLLVSFMNAQSIRNVEDNQLALNFLLPGVVYEAGISENATLATELTVGFAYRESTFFEDGFGIYPIGRFQYRYYYNFQRRLEKGKRIAGNTGNYLAPTIAVQSGKAISATWITALIILLEWASFMAYSEPHQKVFSLDLKRVLHISLTNLIKDLVYCLQQSLAGSYANNGEINPSKSIT